MKKKHPSLFALPPLLFFSATAWIPLLFLIGGSLMSSAELNNYLAPVLGDKAGFASWRFMPLFPTLSSYAKLLIDTPSFFVLFWNSARLSVFTLIGQFLVATPAAWWFARSRSRMGKWLFTLYVVLMLMPFQVTMVSTYLVMNTAGLIDNHLSILLPSIFSAFPVFILYHSFASIPEATIEAAQIDGANGFQIFWHIGIPSAKGGLSIAMVLGFLEAWCLMEPPLVFLKTQSLWPLSIFLPQVRLEQAGFAMVASIITLLPPVLVFLYGQTDLEQGFASAGVKG